MARVGLAVMRIQPLHKGHCLTINRMIQDCETSIICIGSAQKSREEHDPWTIEERMQMLKNVYGDRIKIVPLNDLGATRPEEWTDYIFEKLAKLGMNEPTDYYTGSVQDSFWYKHCFFAKELGNQYNDSNPDFMDEYEYFDGKTQCFRKLHLIDRDMNPVPAATEIRGFLQLRANGWKEWVPRVNHSLVEKMYPEEFKVPWNE